MLDGLGHATENHSVNHGLLPGTPDQVALNAALAVIAGVRPKDEIEAMLAAHMAVTNIALLELAARTREAIAGHPYEGNGIKRLAVLGGLTNRFMRTFTMQVEALARKRRKRDQNIRVKHVHVYAGGQAVVGNVRNQRLTVANPRPRRHWAAKVISATGKPGRGRGQLCISCTDALCDVKQYDL
jgi:hypothetical protein